MYIYTADGCHISHVERDRIPGFVEVYCTLTRFVMLLCECMMAVAGWGWCWGEGGRAKGQYLINLNLRLKVKINQVPGGTFLKRSGPLARIKIKGKSHGV